MSKVIKIENLSKMYDLGLVGTGTLSKDLNRTWARLRGKPDPYATLAELNVRSEKSKSNTVWALKDINLEVEQGEVLGIIGKNGAGKSTLLKILSRITTPTTGSIKMHGRVGSLLEVGTGMHPEMTARQNIFLNGAIMGMTRKEIKLKLDDIVDFAGIGKYIDTPIKRFSSGMKVRLGFAVAAFLEPEILIVDEVLAVGDAEFQKKAIGKMQDVSKGGGRTVLFVSHNMAAVKSLCSRTILIENGFVKQSGDTEKIVDEYLQTKTHISLEEKLKSIGPLEEIEIRDLQLLSDNNFTISEKINIQIDFCIRIELEKFNLSLVLYDKNENAVFNSITPVKKMTPGNYTATLEIPDNLLNDTEYNIRLLFVNNSKAIIDLYDLAFFETVETEKRHINWYGKFIGIIRPKLKWEIKKT